MCAGRPVVMSQAAAPSAGAALTDVLAQLEEQQPTLPDAVTAHYLAEAGLDTDDPRLVRLIAIAAQKFVSDVAHDALQLYKMRQASLPSKNKAKDKKYVLTLEDLSQALADHGIQVKKPAYFV